MTSHTLRLASEPFQAIKNGSKIIESRLYDEKRQQIHVGDELIFENREVSSEQVIVRVIELICANTFEELFTMRDAKLFGKNSAKELLKQIGEFYSAEDQKIHGVVGIVFEKVKVDNLL